MITKFVFYPTVATEVPFGEEFKELVVGMASDRAAVAHCSRFGVVMAASLASIKRLSNVTLVKSTRFEFSREDFIGFFLQGCLLVHDIDSGYYLFLVAWVAVGHDQSIKRGGGRREGEEKHHTQVTRARFGKS